MNKKKNQSQPSRDWPTVDMLTFQGDLDTYIWKVYAKHNRHYIDCINDGSGRFKEVPKNMFPKDCLEINLFKTETYNPKLKGGFKRDLFKAKREDEPQRFKRLVIPSEIYSNLSEIISVNKLNGLHDSILEILAITQEFYIYMTDSWDTGDGIFSYKKIKSETNNLMQIIDEYDKSRNSTGGERPKLKSISFKFNKFSIKLEDARFLREIVTLMKDHYNTGSNDWRVNLNSIPEDFALSESEQKFKYAIVNSYYNLLTNYGGFKVNDKIPTPNQLMLCIASIIEHAYVIDQHEAEDVKIKIVRNWYNRGK